MTSVKSSSLAPAGAPVGSAVMFEAQQPDDVTIYGRRYLKSGFIETDSALFDLSVFTTKTADNAALTDISFGAATGYATCWGNGQFVAVGSGGSISTSADGVTWVARTSGTTQNLLDILYADGLSIFVATGANGVVLTSGDGINWSPRASGFGSFDVNSVAYDSDNDLLLIVGNVDNIATSSDGITWTARSAVGSGYNYVDATFGGGIFVVITSTNDANRLQYSADGISWSPGTSSQLYTKIAFGNGIFVATYNAASLYYVSDPTVSTWVFNSVPTSFIPNSLNFSNGVFSYTTSDETELAISVNGINWDGITLPSGAHQNNGATASLDALVTVGSSSVGNKLDVFNYAGSRTSYSADGQNQYIRIS